MRLAREGTFEANVLAINPELELKFRDLTWEADTVFRQGTEIERWRTDGFGDLDSQLRRIGATIAIVQYGQVESLDPKVDPKSFSLGYRNLVEKLVKHCRHVILIPPIRFETPQNQLLPDLAERNEALEVLIENAQIATHDLEGVIWLDWNQEDSPPPEASLTKNGMHVVDERQPAVAESMLQKLSGDPEFVSDVAIPNGLLDAVREKNRLWYDFWRPANWKLLYGDDSRRVFTRGGENYIPFREEWKQLVPMIARAEERVWAIAKGAKDPGWQRPDPEVLHGAPEADIAQELDSFEVFDGLEVNLFASEKDGLTSPLNVRWDPAGRMYVSVTTTYPHVYPGDIPNDKILILQDRDGDGVCDSSTEFASGLNIPTGFEIYDGGVIVGQSTEILFLKDTDGDLKADHREVLLSGFGNGDSHQTINSFVWSPSGELFLGQGDGIESRVETPWGVSDLFQSGFYRLRPGTLEMLPFLDDHKGPGNPWGVAFNEWGQAFSVDGAGGVTWLNPAMAPTSRGPKYRPVGRIGEPGGYCGIGSVSNPAMPTALLGSFVVGDYKQNRVKRFRLSDNGSGFKLEWEPALLRSKHRNFRPVDVKTGPDGAIYVVDWYNPITCHQDDAYRDPTRDKAHGRIWRISVPGESKSVAPDLSKLEADELVAMLEHPYPQVRYQVKRQLSALDRQLAATSLDNWVAKLSKRQNATDVQSERLSNADYEKLLFEALGCYASIDTVRAELLERLLDAESHGARSFATRLIGRWRTRLTRPLALLAEQIQDAHPQVRLEAIVACAMIPSSNAIAVVLPALDLPMDRPMKYALEQTIRYLKPVWLPALEKGELSNLSPKHLTQLLKYGEAEATLSRLRELMQREELNLEARLDVLPMLMALGSQDDLAAFVLNPGNYTKSGSYHPEAHADMLWVFVEQMQSRELIPSAGIEEALQEILEERSSETFAPAIRLAGFWKLTRHNNLIVDAAAKSSVSSNQFAAFHALADMEHPSAASILASWTEPNIKPEIRTQAALAWLKLNLQEAMPSAVNLLVDKRLGNPQMLQILDAVLAKAGGAETLANELLKTAGQLDSDRSKMLLQSVYQLGRSDLALVRALSQDQNTIKRPYSETLVRRLVGGAIEYGNSDRGELIFKSAACASCHRVGGSGGKVGPNLTAIGTTLSPERIVEEVLWPNRQIKEGYSVLQALTVDSELRSGYLRRDAASQESGDLLLEDIASKKLIRIPADEVEQTKQLGSPMPEGIVELLTDQQLQDLIAYLRGLGTL
ncbi:MAG: PVC-type heme-binding CxxCH protein [Planctomycetota bacterium]